jgi:transketolase
VLASFGDGVRPPRVTKLAAHTIPGSATPAEQLHVAGIDAKAIEAAVHALVDEARAVPA